MLGTTIDGHDAVVPADGVIQVAFNRYLLPATITRQSYVIFDNFDKPLPNVPLRTLYDPIARTVTITGPEGPGKPWLTEGQLYKLVLPIPDDATSDIGGFRAIDRAPLAAGQRRSFPFRVVASAGQTSVEPSVDFCADVLPIFRNKCAGSSCHGASTSAAAGLVLETSDGIRVTARGRVAQGSNTSARASTPAPTPSLFGFDMPILQPGDPGSSWLLYKVELARLPTADAGPKPTFACTPPAGSPPMPAPAAAFAPLAPARQAPDDGERRILDDFILGNEMPYPSPPSAYVVPAPTETNPHPSVYGVTPLDFQERELVRIWIENGADVRDCGACTITP